tara:strand:+ start:343 stop:540 length:198 start_codon:yes stop_codon:yes gene_type:complete
MKKINRKFLLGTSFLTVIIILSIVYQTQIIKIFTQKKETSDLDNLKWLDEMKKQSYEESLITPKQ